MSKVFDDWWNSDHHPFDMEDEDEKKDAEVVWNVALRHAAEAINNQASQENSDAVFDFADKVATTLREEIENGNFRKMPKRT